MSNLGAADSRSLIMMNGGCDEIRPRVGPSESMAWPLCGASGSHPRAVSSMGPKFKVVGALEVCAKALQQRTGLVSSKH
jgi:hypothetical protein